MKPFDNLQHYFLGSKRIFFPHFHTPRTLHLTLLNLSDKTVL